MPRRPGEGQQVNNVPCHAKSSGFQCSIPCTAIWSPQEKRKKSKMLLLLKQKHQAWGKFRHPMWWATFCPVGWAHPKPNMSWHPCKETTQPKAWWWVSPSPQQVFLSPEQDPIAEGNTTSSDTPGVSGCTTANSGHSPNLLPDKTQKFGDCCRILALMVKNKSQQEHPSSTSRAGLRKASKSTADTRHQADGSSCPLLLSSPSLPKLVI